MNNVLGEIQTKGIKNLIRVEFREKYNTAGFFGSGITDRKGTEVEAIYEFALFFPLMQYYQELWDKRFGDSTRNVTNEMLRNKTDFTFYIDSWKNNEEKKEIFKYQKSKIINEVADTISNIIERIHEFEQITKGE